MTIKNTTTKKKNLDMFGSANSHDRYQALLSLMLNAIAQGKATGKSIGFNVLGARHPKALSNLLPASLGDLADSDSRNLIDQIRTALMSQEVLDTHGVYDVAYNFDEDIEPRFDFYIVRVPVGTDALDLTSLISN